jgi:hypothetical protein
MVSLVRGRASVVAGSVVAGSVTSRRGMRAAAAAERVKKMGRDFGYHGARAAERDRGRGLGRRNDRWMVSRAFGADEIARSVHESYGSIALGGGGDFGLLSLVAYASAHPTIAVCALLALLWVVPLFIDAAWKFVLLPVAVASAAFVAVSDPSGSVKFVESLVDEITRHPSEILAIVGVFVALALAPYLLGFALVALVVSGVSVMPSSLAPALPRELVAASDKLERLQRKVYPRVSEIESFANEVQSKRLELKAARLSAKRGEAARD